MKVQKVPAWVLRAALPVTPAEVGRVVAESCHMGPDNVHRAQQAGRDAVQADSAAVAEIAAGPDLDSLVVRGVVAFDRVRSAVFLPLGRGRRKRSLFDDGGRAANIYRVRIYKFRAAPDLGAEEP